MMAKDEYIQMKGKRDERHRGKNNALSHIDKTNVSTMCGSVLLVDAIKSYRNYNKEFPIQDATYT